MVVTSSAMKRQSKETARGCRDKVVHMISANLSREADVIVPHRVMGSTDDEGRCDDQLTVFAIKLVPRKLFEDESIVGRVVVEGLNDVVAVRPGVCANAILLVTVTLTESHNVEPVSAPSLTIVRGTKKAVDEELVGVCARISNEGVDLFWSRRQADEIKGHASNDRRAIRRLAGAKALL